MFGKGSEITYTYSKDDVIKAVSKAIGGISGMKLHSCDVVSGHIVAKTGMSAFSYGENISIDVSSLPDESGVSVKISSGAKTGLLFGGAADFGKNQKNVDQIITNTSAILRAECQPIRKAVDQSSPEQKLQQLNKLLSSGLITQEEYEQKRKGIVESI